MAVKIRRGEQQDIPFLAWVMYTAARSHLADCPWCVIYGESEKRTRILLAALSQIPVLPWSYFSKFWIAEVDGVPAAAMCGFVPAEPLSSTMAEPELVVAKQVFGYSETRLVAIRERLAVTALGFPEDLPDIWAIENVAVLPEFRGMGLIDQLFEQTLEEGRQRGFKRAQILSLIGNEAGQRAFERNGFKVVSEKRSVVFDEWFGTPGGKLLARDL